MIKLFRQDKYGEYDEISVNLVDPVKKKEKGLFFSLSPVYHIPKGVV
ncbi:MAG: hypothetical protein ACYS3S_13815 [Planctomycetota bacterium]|jgi:hypothetical protein